MRLDKLLSERLNYFGIFFLLLISADIGFAFVHLAHELTPLLQDRLFSIETDRGYAEIFQYVKTYWIAIMLAILWWRTREWVYIAWMLLYTYMLLDDGTQIHERGGAVIAKNWGYEGAFGFRAQDFGELTISGFFGFVLFGLILIMYFRSTRDAKNASKDLTLLFVAIAFFGIVVDILHVLLEGFYSNLIFGLVEDGGEMLVMSVACWYVMNLLERRGNTPSSFWQLCK
jgi:hypothetical protein